MSNRLGSERSAYLRSAAHQPVHWLPWGQAAFAQAKAEDKPLLLDIGAVWCHWCHVIDRESYDDPALAQLINEHFVPVKVDRDERPDVDARYQLAIQALTGQGGWPLTAFLDGDGRVFYGGTYFPPQDGHGRPAFRTVLTSIAQAWKERREELLAHGAHLHQELQRFSEKAAPGALRAAMVDEAAARTLHQADLINGGFGGAPKFPHPSTVELLLARWARTKDPATHTVLQATLDGMARGGVYDHLGGGFHRYSVDAEWIVPHFEKMLYDNAGLLRNYAHAAMLWQAPLHRAATEGIVRWLREVMALPEGGFAGSQDADVGLDDDGDYWTWTLDEVRAAVPDPQVQGLLRAHYDIGERGEMHHDPRKNVLFVRRPLEDLAREQGLPPGLAQELLDKGKALMLAARAQRAAPYVDRAVFVSWNAMTASALFEAWKALGDPWCRDAALRTVDRLLREAHDPAKGMAHVLRDGHAEVHGLLEDQVWTAQALLDAYEVSGQPRYLSVAEELLRFTLDRFQDPASGALHDTASGLHDAEGIAALGTKRTPIEDAPVASPNAVGALALQHLAALTGHEGYAGAARRVLEAFAGTAPRMGLFAGSWLLAVERHIQGHTQVVIAGPPGDKLARELHEAALRAYAPGKVVVPPAEGAAVPGAAREALASGVARQGAVALVCRGTSCSPPVRSPEALAATLQRG